MTSARAAAANRRADDQAHRRTGGEDPGVSAEKARSDIAATQMWVCPGPEWPPEEETCGRMLEHTGRCKHCAAKRMKLRKAERRERQRETKKQQTPSTELAFPFPIM